MNFQYPKSIPKPKVICLDLPNAGGCYLYPYENHVWKIGGKEFHSKDHRGIIVISDRYHTDDSTWYHEYCHHIQWYSGVKLNKVKKDWGDFYKENGFDYNKSIVNYFLTQQHEMQALIYSQLIFPSETDQNWLRLIKKHYDIKSSLQ